MSNVNPFKQSGQWYRGNTHSHSTESDGRLPMADRFAAYREAGYDFLVLTDHRKVNDVSAHSRDGFLAISGSEVHPNNPYGGDTYHIVGINLHERINCAEMHPNAVIEEIKRQGGRSGALPPLLVWAHAAGLSTAEWILCGRGLQRHLHGYRQGLFRASLGRFIGQGRSPRFRHRCR